jgi:hypothetical protein
VLTFVSGIERKEDVGETSEEWILVRAADTVSVA